MNKDFSFFLFFFCMMISFNINMTYDLNIIAWCGTLAMFYLCEEVLPFFYFSGIVQWHLLNDVLLDDLMYFTVLSDVMPIVHVCI